MENTGFDFDSVAAREHAAALAARCQATPELYSELEWQFVTACQARLAGEESLSAREFAWLNRISVRAEETAEGRQLVQELVAHAEGFARRDRDMLRVLQAAVSTPGVLLTDAQLEWARRAQAIVRVLTTTMGDAAASQVNAVLRKAVQECLAGADLLRKDERRQLLNMKTAVLRLGPFSLSAEQCDWLLKLWHRLQVGCGQADRLRDGMAALEVLVANQGVLNAEQRKRFHRVRANLKEGGRLSLADADALAHIARHLATPPASRPKARGRRASGRRSGRDGVHRWER